MIRWLRSSARGRVTGSTAGIGFAIVKALAAKGARVMVSGRSEKRVADAVVGTRAAVRTARLGLLTLDLAKAEIVTKTDSRFPEPKPFQELTDADRLAIIEMNFLSGVRLDQGGGDHGAAGGSP